MAPQVQIMVVKVSIQVMKVTATSLLKTMMTTMTTEKIYLLARTTYPCQLSLNPPLSLHSLKIGGMKSRGERYFNEAKKGMFV